jgi:hypothetical protein
MGHEAGGAVTTWPPAGYYCCGEVYARGGVWEGSLPSARLGATNPLSDATPLPSAAARDEPSRPSPWLEQEPLWCILLEALVALPHATLANRRLVRKKYRLHASDAELRHVDKLTRIADCVFFSTEGGEQGCRPLGCLLASSLPCVWSAMLTQQVVELATRRADARESSTPVAGVLAVNMYTGLLVTTENVRPLAAAAGVAGAHAFGANRTCCGGVARLLSTKVLRPDASSTYYHL